MPSRFFVVMFSSISPIWKVTVRTAKITMDTAAMDAWITYGKLQQSAQRPRGRVHA